MRAGTQEVVVQVKLGRIDDAVTPSAGRERARQQGVE
jgi:hypothetical protein